MDILALDKRAIEPIAIVGPGQDNDVVNNLKQDNKEVAKPAVDVFIIE